MVESIIDKLGNELIPVVAIVGGLSFASFWVICATVVSLYRTWLNSKIKTQLIQRGASAEEIKSIVESGHHSATFDYQTNTPQVPTAPIPQTQPMRQPTKPVKRYTAV